MLIMSTSSEPPALVAEAWKKAEPKHKKEKDFVRGDSIQCQKLGGECIQMAPLTNAVG